MKTPKIIFAGTPEFAAVSLQALLDAGYSIEMVYTQPDRPAGRGQQLTPSPVKLLAQRYHLPVRQPTNLRAAEEQHALAELNADLMIVVAYGLILPAAILTAPRLGCINVHASLLPRWRGAAPIQHAILAGDVRTGVTIMQMDEGLDTGPMLEKSICPIQPKDTSQDLHDRLAKLGAHALLTTLAKLSSGDIIDSPQDSEQACYASKINKQMAQLQWQQSAAQLDRAIRAYNPWPIAFTQLNDQILRIWQAEPLATSTAATPGTILQAAKTGIDIATGDGVLRLLKIQLAGGKPLPVTEVLNAKQALFQIGQYLR